MNVTVGTFNLNNLFSRYNFRFSAEAPALKEGEIEFTKVRKFIGDLQSQPVEYRGRVLHHKSAKDRQTIAQRITAMDLDVLAVQEVEDIDTLRYFAQHELPKGLYPHLILIEGNDPRLIDLAVLSKYPIGAVTSWQHAVHPDNPNERVFGRDLLQVEILNKSRSQPLFTLFNNHLKSHFVPFNEDQSKGKQQANLRRKRQIEMLARILEQTMGKTEKYLVVGDFNDPPESPLLAPLTTQLHLVNGLQDPLEIGKLNKPSEASEIAWTHRFKPRGLPAEYQLLDQVWLSPTAAKHQTGAFIQRRRILTGDGSDHDPAWVTLDI